jgi:hypothetical protein
MLWNLSQSYFTLITLKDDCLNLSTISAICASICHILNQNILNLTIWFSFMMKLLCALGFLAVASCVIVGVVVYYAGVAGLQQQVGHPIWWIAVNSGFVSTKKNLRWPSIWKFQSYTLLVLSFTPQAWLLLPFNFFIFAPKTIIKTSFAKPHNFCMAPAPC